MNFTVNRKIEIVRSDKSHKVIYKNIIKNSIRSQDNQQVYMWSHLIEKIQSI